MKLRKWLHEKQYLKLVICFAILALQILYWFFLFYQISCTHKAFGIVVKVVSVLLAFSILITEESPHQKLTYCFLILWIPVLGILYYMLFHFHPARRKNAQKYKEICEYYFPTPKQEKTSEAKAWYGKEQALLQFIWSHTRFQSCAEMDSKYYSLGEESYEQLLYDLNHARSYVLLEFFIMEPGILLDAILECLYDRINCGVEVYLIYDALGSAGTLPAKFYRKLQAKGIHCASFHPIGPMLSPMINNRDHRKLIVIDDEKSYMGGINLADEYINCKKKYGRWKDCVIRTTGACSVQNRKMFCCLWTYITGSYLRLPVQRLDDEDIKRQVGNQNSPDRGGDSFDGRVTPFSSSPFDEKSLARGIYLRAIYEAREYLYIFTPYLILDSEFVTALCIAANSGVDVRIVTPGIPDKKLVYMETQSFYPVLLKEGVKIYQYTPGFLHAKCLLYDDKVAIVGSVNLDFRSMYHHFECGMILYESMAISTIKLDIVSTIKESKSVTLGEAKKPKTTIYRGLQCVLRLLNPMM